MNINGVLGQFNISRAGVQQPAFNGKVSITKKDSFQKGNYVSAPVKTAVSGNKTIPLSNFYTPKQLLRAYSNPDYVEVLINSNKNIQTMCAEKGIEVQIHPENVLGIVNSHLTTTTSTALQIANEMGLSASDKKILEQACVFHDFGKILIPKEILNKPGKLDASEKEIMDMHAELGYELLSETDMNNRVLNLIRNHHNLQSENADILCQILSVADIYSALREERCYKHSMSQQDALNLLDQKAMGGEVSTEVVNALKATLLTRKSA